MISQSEAASLLDCQAQHDFRYVGQLVGSALTPKSTAPLLREGRAWGRAVATWHAATGTAEERAGEAGAALFHSLHGDAEAQREAGLYVAEEHEETLARLTPMLAHYAETAEPLALTSPEAEIDVPIPSRGGRRRSNAYHLLCRLDGIHVDPDGRIWIVEFKLRKQLSSLAQIALSRQVRWYAWAYRERYGSEPAGVIVDERLNAVPAPVKLNQDGRPSAVQSCTLDAYTRAHGRDPAVLDRLRAKQWQRRERVLLRPDEFAAVGRQLVTVARMVRELESGRFFPVPNPSPMRCPGCAFRDICPNPGDVELVDALFERVPAKRDREGELSHVA